MTATAQTARELRTMAKGLRADAKRIERSASILDPEESAELTAGQKAARTRKLRARGRRAAATRRMNKENSDGSIDNDPA